MKPVLILGTGITPLGVMRTLRRAGIPFFAHSQPPGIEHRSRWFRPAPLRRDPGPTPSLTELLDAVDLDQAVLMPCSDAFARQAACLPEALRDRFPVSISSPETIEILVDKARFGALLAELGVPHPLTRVLKSPDEIAAVPEPVLEGAFLKPHDSQSFFARFGVKAFHIASPAAAAERMAEVQKAGLEVLLQEYIPGPGSLHYFVDGFLDASGTLRAVFARHRLRMHPPDFGNSSYMVSVPPELAAQAIDSIRRVLEKLRFRGMFSAEFKRDPGDGLFKLIEVNARAWWYVEFAARCGVDVCSLAYRDALGLPLADVAGYRAGQRLVYPYYDYFACRQAHESGQLTRLEWLRSWAGAQQPLFNWSDPAPAWAEAWGTAGHRFLRRIGWRR